MLRTTRILKLPNQIALMALVLCATAVLGKSQDAYQGKFTLPFEAHWAGATLPAGEYTISMPDAEISPYWLYVRGQGQVAIIMATATDTKAVSKQSQLAVVNTGGREAITSLEAGQLGMTFDYAVSKSKSAKSNETKTETQTESTLRVNVPVRGFGAPVAGR